MIQLTFTPQEIFENAPESKTEFIEWAMSDQDFLSELLKLMANGSTDRCSWPWNVEELQARFTAILGDEGLAAVYKERAENKEGREKAERRAIWLENDLARAKSINKEGEDQRAQFNMFLLALVEGRGTQKELAKVARKMLQHPKDSVEAMLAAHIKSGEEA